MHKIVTILVLLLIANCPFAECLPHLQDHPNAAVVHHTHKTISSNRRSNLQKRAEQRFGQIEKQFSPLLPAYAVTYSEDEKASQRAQATALQAALQSAIQSNAPSFTIQPGTYRFPGGFFDSAIYSARNFVINAADVAFITESSSGKNGFFTAFNFRQSRNITINGPLTWDTDPLPYSQGIITSVNQKLGYFTIDLLPGWSYDGKTLKRFLVFDPSGALISWTQSSIKKVQKISGDGSQWKVWPDSINGQYWSNPQLAGTQMKVGNIVALEINSEGTSTSSCFATYVNCDSMSMQDILIYSGGMPLWERQTSTYSRLTNVSCQIPPGTNRLIDGSLSQHDLFNGTLIIENSRYGVHWDDGLNLMGSWHMVAQQVNSRQLIIASRIYPVSNDTNIMFYNPDTMALIKTANVVNSVPVNDNGLVNDILAHNNNDLHLHAMQTVILAQVSLDRDVAVPKYSWVATGTGRADQVIVRNSLFSDTSAQILLVQGAKSGIIDNNVLLRSFGPAVQIGFSVFWWEGPNPMNIVISNNDIETNPVNHMWFTEMGSIYVYGQGIKPYKSRIMSNITILSNTISNSSFAGIYVRNTKQVVIKNNKIINPAWRQLTWFDNKPMTPPAGAIDLNAVTDVVIANNDIDLSDSFCKSAVYVGNDALMVVQSGNNVVTNNRTSVSRGVGGDVISI